MGRTASASRVVAGLALLMCLASAPSFAGDPALDDHYRRIHQELLEAISAASAHRYLFADHYTRNGELPRSDAELGITPADYELPASIENITISNGAVRVDFSSDAAPKLQDSTFEFIPTTTSPSRLFFKCHLSGSAAAYFEQRDCVLIDEPPEPITTIRAQVQRILDDTAAVRWYYEEHFREDQFFAPNLAFLGLRFGTLTTNLLGSIRPIGDLVTLTPNSDAHAELQGTYLYLRAENKGAAISYECEVFGIDPARAGLPTDRPCIDTPTITDIELTEIRRQVESAYSAGAALQPFVEAHFEAQGRLPSPIRVANNEQIGAPPPDELRGSYVDRITVTGEATITIYFRNDTVHPVLRDQNVVIFSGVLWRLGVVWQCRPGSLSPNPLWIPPRCRS